MPITITQESQTSDTAKITRIDIDVISQNITFIVAKGLMNGENFIAKSSQRVKVKGDEFAELITKIPVDTNGVAIDGTVANPVAKNLYDQISDIAYAFLIEKGHLAV